MSPLARKLEEELPRLSRRIDRAVKRRTFIRAELSRLRVGQSEAETVARLSEAGVRVSP